MTTWKQFLARLGVASVVMGTTAFIAIRAAVADPGGRSRDWLTVTGTLTGVTGTPALAFTLRKMGATCPVTAQNVVLSGTSFSAELPLNGCPAFFDGSDVTVDVSVNGTPVVTGSAVNPVPYARYADQTGTPDCPVGYERFSVAGGPVGAIYCRKGLDEVVRVGSGASAFWIDRYEASVWSDSTATATQYGLREGDYPPSFPVNGNWTAAFVAMSRPGQLPSQWTSWFQVNAACRNAGKRLPRNDEWTAAASGTIDPGASSGSGGACNTTSDSIRRTGQGVNCRSRWGAEDFIGNVDEMIEEWADSVGTAPSSFVQAPWVGDDFYGDTTYGYSSGGVGFGGSTQANAPNFISRGGSAAGGMRAGIFTIASYSTPTRASPSGFRCVIPR